jgi:RNA polymerase sigma factor (sigma-70 family)
LTIEKDKVFHYWDDIAALGVRRFGQTPLAEEAVLAAIDGLEKDDWKRVREFQGEASFKSYLRVLVLRLFEDFARKRFGRLRPPAWVTRLGGIWPRLFAALCLERNDVLSAVELVYQGLVRPEKDAQDKDKVKKEKSSIEDAAYTLLGRIPDCGSSTAEVSMDEEGKGGVVADPVNVEDFETRQSRELVESIFQIVLGKETEFNGSKVAEKLNLLNISLTPEEKLLLKLCYQDGLNVSKAGAMLGLTRFQAHGRMKRLMERLRAEFERVGLAMEIEAILR